MVIAEPLLLATQATVYRHRRRRRPTTVAKAFTGCSYSRLLVIPHRAVIYQWSNIITITGYSIVAVLIFIFNSLYVD